jgi:hypothetical protein
MYRQWLSIDEGGITYGAKRTQWQAIDEVDLTILGNLLFKSRSVCGTALLKGATDLNPAEPVLKIALGAVSQRAQKVFFEILAHQRPEVLYNNRLRRHLSKKMLLEVPWVQGLGVIFLAAIILDLGYSSFSYLETLKHYFLSKKLAQTATKDDAKVHLARAEWLRLHPIAISWISRNVFSEGVIAAGLEQARSEALWELDYKQEAIDAAKTAARFSPRTFRFYLRLARLYSAVHQDPLAAAEIGMAIDDKKEALLPRLYMMALLLEEGREQLAQKLYDDYAKELQESVFDKEPVWPPGGDCFIHDIWYKDDLDFVFGRMLKTSPDDKVSR